MSQIPYEILNARYEFTPDKIVMHPIEAMITGGLPKESMERLPLTLLTKLLVKNMRLPKDSQRICSD